MKTRRWLAHPALSVLLAASWLLLQHSLEGVHLLSAVLIGLVIPWLLDPFLPETTAIRWVPAVRLARRVVWDVIVSNFVVARLVLGPMPRLRPAWVPVKLALTHPTAISLLATIITTTPGTVSCTIDEARRTIWVHALDCEDPDRMAADIKASYEEPLLMIFETTQPPEGKP
jgi:multicomponent K+:H+ antiporter subunit E